jgi:hypothetical protein
MTRVSVGALLALGLLAAMPIAIVARSPVRWMSELLRPTAVRMPGERR